MIAASVAALICAFAIAAGHMVREINRNPDSDVSHADEAAPGPNLGQAER